MSIELTEEQRQALDTGRETPVRVIDPRTNTAYILLPSEEYENVREILDEEKHRKVIHEIALRNAMGRERLEC